VVGIVPALTKGDDGNPPAISAQVTWGRRGQGGGFRFQKLGCKIRAAWGLGGKGKGLG
jgi:hypothetical protein